MAVDVHNLGEFTSISEAWKMYPNGGGFGDYITVNGVRVDWNEYSRSWGEQTETGGTTRPDEVVPHSIDVQGTGTFRDGVKVGSYVKDTSGALIDGLGNAEFRNVQLDSLRVRFGTGYVPLSDFIKTFKTELPPDWIEYENTPLFDDIRLLVFDAASNEKYYTTIGALKAVIGSGGSSGGGTVNIEIIRSDDPDKTPTDNNVFSALSTLYHIANKSISKTENDTAQGIIKFIKGIEVGQFISGLFGSGASLKNDNGVSRLEVDHLLVRMRAEFFSILVNNAKHVGGQQINSAANMICIKVEETTDFYRCYFDTGNNNEVINLFENTDRARCQVFTGSGQKFYWRKVVAVGPDYIELSKTDCAPGTNDVPTVGDHIFQLGSDNPDRQGAWITSSVGPDAPYMKQYSGIDGYTLEGKALTMFTRNGNRIVGTTVFLSSGHNLDEWATGTSQDIQDAQGAANAAALAAQQAIDDAAANVTDYNAKFAVVQAQIDGEVSNWFYPYSPTLANYPASDWTTNTIKDRHIGDTFTNTQQAPATDAGKSWRFVKNGTVYSWTQIADSDAVLALQKAAQAQSAADGKSTTYLIQPTSYKLGDMWVLAADQTVNGIAYKSGEILTATQDSTTYNQAHWVKKVRYTDDTAVNNLRIGVNIFNNSEAERTGQRFLEIPVRTFLEPYVGKSIVVSFDIKSTVAGRAISVYPYQNSGISIATEKTITSTLEYQRFVLKTTVKDWGQIAGMSTGSIGIYDTIGESTITVRRISVSIGTTEIAWELSDADVQAKIDDAKQEALTAAGNAQTSANNANMAVGDLNTYVDGSFKDGVIEASEAKAIEKYINIVNTEKSNLEATYNTLYVNTYLEGAAKINLLNAKVTYFGAVDTLLASINTAISDGKTTIAEKQAVDTNYSSYKTALASLQSAIEEANKAIQAKLDALSTEKVNNLQIGVENFYHTKSEHANYDVVLFSKTAKGFEGIGNYNGQYPNATIRINNIISSNGDWTVKFKAKSNANVPLLCDICDLTVNTFWLNAEFQEFQFTQNVTNYAEGGVYHFIDFVLPSYAWYYIEDLMVVKGNKAPASWIESSKDVQERINDAATVASDAQAKANTAKAVTDKFSGFDGGLATAVIMEMREPSTTTRGDATAGISGIQKDASNNFMPAIWAGGTYADALSGAAKAIIRHDGKVKFTEGEFSGGTIAGWNISSGRIGKIQAGTGLPTDTGLSLYDNFIKFSDSESSVFFGTNVLPATTGMVGMGRITNTNANIKKIGLYFDMAGADTSFWDGSSNNIAIYINRGVISGAKFNGVNKNLTSAGYTIGKETVVCIYTTANYTVRLPANPETWEFKWIFGMNSQNYTLSGNGKNIWSPLVGNVTSLTFNSGMLVYTGQEWAIFS